MMKVGIEGSVDEMKVEDLVLVEDGSVGLKIYDWDGKLGRGSLSENGK